MPRRALVLRPAPGNARTCAALAAAGVAAVALPLFRIVPCAWAAPDPAAHDALLLTSANAVRQAGAGLARLAHLPVVAVGAATAEAARGAGLSVALTGSGDVAAVVARAGAWPRLLHLAGRERIAHPGVVAITVYASEAVDVPPEALAGAGGAVVLLHSPRAAARFVALLGTRSRADIRVAALSDAVAAAAGAGWDALAVAPEPDDAALVAAAARLAD